MRTWSGDTSSLMTSNVSTVSTSQHAGGAKTLLRHWSWAIANASYKRQRRNDAVTEIKQMPNRGHALTIDSGWRDVADTALAFAARFVAAGAA